MFSIAASRLACFFFFDEPRESRLICSFAALAEMAILLLYSLSAMTPASVPTAASSLSVRESSSDHGAGLPLRLMAHHFGFRCASSTSSARPSILKDLAR